MISEQDLRYTQEYDSITYEREAIRYYIVCLRQDHPSKMKRSRQEYERTINVILSESEQDWRVVIDDEKENDDFYNKFGFYAGEANIISAGYSKYEVSTVLTLRPTTLDGEVDLEIPISHIPAEYRLLTEEEYRSEH